METGKPVANAAATIYVIFEDEDKKNEEAVIETQTDSAELYTMFD